MKIFDKDNSFSHSINFVDDNNVVLGYSLEQNCCEHADWFIDSKKWLDVPTLEEIRKMQERRVYAGFRFDPCWRQTIQEGEFTDGGMVIFRIEKGSECMYIHIFNIQNGYYSHGFEFKVGENVIGGAI